MVGKKLAVCVGLILLAVGSILLGCRRQGPPVFVSRFPAKTSRVWIGPEYWANRLQDWRLERGKIVCVNTLPKLRYRTLHLLTHRLSPQEGRLRMSVVFGPGRPDHLLAPGAAAGFLLGAGHGKLDYRAAALIHHSWGPLAGLMILYEAPGRLVVRDMEKEGYPVLVQSNSLAGPLPERVRLAVEVVPQRNGYRLVAALENPETRAQLARLALAPVAPERLVGNIALVAHPGTEGQGNRWWFADWKAAGSKLEVHEEDRFGPVVSTLYTLSRGVLKLTAQLMPVAKDDPQTVALQIRRGRAWETVQTSRISQMGYTATFRVSGWDAAKSVAYRVVYRLPAVDETFAECVWEGTIRKDPADKPVFVIAAFTGNRNTAQPEPWKWAGIDAGYFPYDQGIFFPHRDVVEHVAAHGPDLLFFSGDQIYEGGSPTRADVANLFLDYLYKWYLWCWAFRDLTCQIPTVVIPDDHDVYHGNLWGCGGKATDPGLRGARAQDSGGYKHPPEFVNMVQRTQTSHLPDPYDPAPALQGIGVYFCELNYGGISFAILEDRKFKSAPKPLLPRAQVWNGWAQNPDFDPRTEADVPEAKLLGDRQLRFLEHWASDWSHGTWMKVVLSQTIFANVATLPEGSKSGAVIPRLPVPEPGEYPENEVPVADMDSNGWPPSGRNRALRIMRKAFAFHIAGDQHLGSTIQYGIEQWRDAGYALCVPSIANAWPRRWFPRMPGKNRKPGAPRYTGDYEDGFGNRMTVLAVANPQKTGRKPERLHDFSPGYGIVRVHRQSRTITFENWPRWADPRRGGKPNSGWPVTFHQLDNYGGRTAGYLPTIEVRGLNHPVIQVIRQDDGKMVYTVRAQGTSFRPKVFQKGTYTVRVGEPDSNLWKVLRDLPVLPPEKQEKRVVIFRNSGTS